MPFFGKGSALYSIFANKCPNCQEGAFWLSGNPYTNLFFKGGKMHENCPNCGLKYSRETGFWFGAAYVSYAIGIAFFVAAWIATTVLLPENSPLWLQIVLVCAFIIVLAPVNLHWSRLIWINFFVKYQSEDKKRV